MTTAARIYDVNDKPLQIVRCLKLYVSVGPLTELPTFIVWERLAVLAKLRCEFCDEMVQCVSPQARSAEIIDVSTVPIICHYERQEPTETVVPEKIKVLKTYGTCLSQNSVHTTRVSSTVQSSHGNGTNGTKRSNPCRTQLPHREMNVV